MTSAKVHSAMLLYCRCCILQTPDRPFRNLGASKSLERRTMCGSETPEAHKIVTGSVGQCRAWCKYLPKYCFLYNNPTSSTHYYYQTEYSPFLKASKSNNTQDLYCSETAESGFWSSSFVKCSVGRGGLLPPHSLNDNTNQKRLERMVQSWFFGYSNEKKGQNCFL